MRISRLLARGWPVSRRALTWVARLASGAILAPHSHSPPESRPPATAALRQRHRGARCVPGGRLARARHSPPRRHHQLLEEPCVHAPEVDPRPAAREAWLRRELGRPHLREDPLLARGQPQQQRARLAGAGCKPPSADAVARPRAASAFVDTRQRQRQTPCLARGDQSLLLSSPKRQPTPSATGRGADGLEDKAAGHATRSATRRAADQATCAARGDHEWYFQRESSRDNIGFVIETTSPARLSSAERSLPAPGHGEAVSAAAARLARWSGAAFAVLLGALHALEPELDPSWRFISEYALGRHGALMVLAFFALALAQLALFAAVRHDAASPAGRIGLAGLVIGAAGLALAGAFTTDPITSSAPPTTSGTLHALGGTLGMGMPIAVGFLSVALARHPAWRSARRPLIATAALGLVGFVVSAASLGILLTRSEGRFGPDVPVGWPTRFEIATFVAWLVTVASCAERVAAEAGRVARSTR